MIVRVFAFLAVLLMIWWGASSFSRRYSLTRNQSRWLLGLSMTLTAVVVLIAMGRLPMQFILAPLGVAATFMLRMLPAILRLLPLWQMISNKNPLQGSRGKRSSDQKSMIRTEFLEMELVHRTGDMDGLVSKGEFAGQRLSTLSLEQLLRLAVECRIDPDSQQVLEAYLDRMHSGWRDQAAGGQESDRNSDRNSELNYEEPAMNRQLALEILGLPDTASLDDVIKAHRKLMQKMHPDRGGTEYLAKKINTARDYLEEHL